MGDVFFRPSSMLYQVIHANERLTIIMNGSSVLWLLEFAKLE